MSLKDLVSVVMVTSYAPSHPSTEMITAALSTLALVEGLGNCRIIIVMDGYVVRSREKAKTKRGRVTDEMANAYEGYCEALAAQHASDPRYLLIRCETHMGFALAVREGLMQCETPYAVVMQHDRRFYHFDRLGDLVTACDRNKTIRYIGFPTSNSDTHRKQIESRYPHLLCLNRMRFEERNQLGDGLSLTPAMFWYDSNHLAHVERYLEIYKPFKTFPKHLCPIMEEHLGRCFQKDLILRTGDFIEDRFGQQQRNMLATLQGHPENEIKDIFNWFGSYFAWYNCNEYDHPYAFREAVEATTDSECNYNDETSDSTSVFHIDKNIQSVTKESLKESLPDTSEPNGRILVSHLRGRTLNPARKLDIMEELQRAATDTETGLRAEPRHIDSGLNKPSIRLASGNQAGNPAEGGSGGSELDGGAQNTQNEANEETGFLFDEENT
jgi:hypothetical protein